MKIREILEEVFLTKDEMFNDEHIRPRIAQAEREIRWMIEGMRKQPEKLPYSDCSQGSGSVGIDPSETIIKIEQQYHTITHEEYNQAISDITEKLFGEK